MCNFLFQLTSSFVIALGILTMRYDSNDSDDDMHQFMVLVLI